MPETNSNITQLTDVINAEMAKWNVPGLSIGIWKDGALATAGFGTANLETGFPVKPETLFQIGSISKVVTTTLAMTCVERGELALDTPMLTYVKDLPLADDTARNMIALRHLVTHMGGFYGDNFSMFGDGDDALQRAIASYGDLLQQNPPGTLWSYCNAGFDLAGRAMEIVTGKTFEALMRERIFEPLGMSRSTYFAKEAILHAVGVGHRQDPDSGQTTVASPWPIPRRSSAAGAIISNVEEVLRFARMHIGDGELDGVRIISSESAKLMRTKQADADIGRTWGLGWALRTLGGVQIVEHNGATNGQTARLTVAPERDFALCILTNHEHGGNAHTAISKAALELSLGLAEPATEYVSVSEATLKSLEGSYERPDDHFVVNAENGGLRIDQATHSNFPGAAPRKASHTLKPISETLFEIQEGNLIGGRVDFTSLQTGDWMRFGGRVARRQ